MTHKFKHHCPEWDDMCIDESMPEFGFCPCFIGNTEAEHYVDMHLKKINDGLEDLSNPDYDDGEWLWHNDAYMEEDQYETLS